MLGLVAVSSRYDGRPVRTDTARFLRDSRSLSFAFDFREADLKTVYVDLHVSHVWNITSINAWIAWPQIRHHGIKVEIDGMNEEAATIVEQLS